MAWSKMTDTEVAPARKWYIEDGETTADIAQRLGRYQSTITRLLVKRRPRKRQGWNKKGLSCILVEKLQAKLETMIANADGEYEVTIAMLERASRSKFSLRAILDALRGRGIYFYPLCQKPTLTSDATLDAISGGGRSRG